MLQAIAALKFAQEVTINAKRFASVVEYQDQLASLSTATQIVALFYHSYRILQLFQQQNAAALIYSAHLAVMVTNWLTPFVFKNY